MLPDDFWELLVKGVLEGAKLLENFEELQLEDASQQLLQRVTH